jgi:hypothetical protein
LKNDGAVPSFSTRRAQYTITDKFGRFGKFGFGTPDDLKSKGHLDRRFIGFVKNKSPYKITSTAIGSISAR